MVMKKLFYLFFVMLLALVACEQLDEPGKSQENTAGNQKDPENNPFIDSFVAKPFSVSATKTVTFSPGNLQYHAVNNEWRFAPSQLDYIGEANANISATYNGWIDLFGWGTGNNPAKSSTDYNDYQTFVDWGVNKIGNDAPNTWRTLTYEEWNYIINIRSNASNLKGVANVNGVNGFVLLPDDWVCPYGVAFESGFHDKSGVEYYAGYQTISASDWVELEGSGAVLLPAAGSRYGSDVYSVQDCGVYRSDTESLWGSAYYLEFYSNEANIGGDFYCSVGQSVRLVQDKK